MQFPAWASKGVHTFHSDFPSSCLRKGFLTSQRIESEQQFTVLRGCNLIVKSLGGHTLLGRTTVLADIYKLEYFRNKQSPFLILKTVVRPGNMEPRVRCCMIPVRWRDGGSLPRRHALSRWPLPSRPPCYFENSKWSGRCHFCCGCVSYFPNANLTGIQSISNAGCPPSALLFFLSLSGSVLVHTTSLALLAFVFEPPDFDASTITARDFIGTIYILQIYHSLLLFLFPPFHPGRKDGCWHILNVLQAPSWERLWRSVGLVLGMPFIC